MPAGFVFFRSDTVKGRRLPPTVEIVRGLLLVALLTGSFESQCLSQGTVPIEEAPPPLSPDEAVTKFQVADGLEISLVVSEPMISQPLSIEFDARGRMWVLQYRQFPNPEGLTPVKVDNWLRTKYDRIPEPPPKGPKGHDRISIYEDTDGDGRVDTAKHFLSDLNLASGMALGHGGVFVAQPPYLLFYPDQDGDDVPDGDPEVLLTGFGMDDAHAFANSLTWGPDGWLYGAQGSTATADIRGIGFQQGVWRYHPLTKEFELFAEGGGNTWGIDFDLDGNLFAGGNTVEPLVHHVQGAYYVKGFGKHGPLHNPHTYGYFQPVKHHGYTGDSLTGGFVLYHGGAFPSRFNGACIAPNTRHSASRWSTLELRGSTFATRAAGDFITSEDIWFRPVDSTVGPDGALYVADWYDYNISHSSPKNRSEWYQPSRNDGRIWRVAPADVSPIPAGEIDLSKRSIAELIELLSHPNDWYARQARRQFAERRDRSAASSLEPLLTGDDQRRALQALWSIHVSGGFNDRLASRLLDSPHEYIRAWTVRLLGDSRDVTSRLMPRLIQLTRDDPSVVVRSQLACTAKRLPTGPAVSIIYELIGRDEDLDDVFVPLLIWWAIEDKSATDTSAVLALVESADAWNRPLVRDVIIRRLARRFMADGTDAGYAACAKLLKLAPDADGVSAVLPGMVEALSGRKLNSVPRSLATAVAGLFEQRRSDPEVVELALRLGLPAINPLQFVNDASIPETHRIRVIRAIGEVQQPSSMDGLLDLAIANNSDGIRSAAFSALGFFNDDRIAAELLKAYPELPPTARAQSISLICGRVGWARKLLESVTKKTIDPKDVSLDSVRRLREHDDGEIQKIVAAVWGHLRTQTPLEKQGRISAVRQLLGRRAGDVARGRILFEKTCANCHKLHGKGNIIGPDLTGAERRDRAKLVENIVDPNAVIRQQFIAHVAVTSDGRVVTGLLAGSDAETVTLLDAKNKRTVLRRADLDELRESPVSLMPEKLLQPLTDQQIRDLFAYLRTDKPVGE